MLRTSPLRFSSRVHVLHFRPHVIRVEHFEAGSIYSYGRKKGQPRERDESQIRGWKKLEGGQGNAPAANAAPATSASPSSAPLAPWQSGQQAA